MLKAEPSQLRSVETEHAVRPSVHSSALENLPVMSELMVRKSYDDGP